MKLRDIVLMCILLFAGCKSASAQLAFVSCGNTISDAEVEMSFSIGQTVVFETESYDFSLTAGVQQPFISLFSNIDDVVEGSYNGVMFYPCPVNTILHVVCDEGSGYSRLLVYNTAGSLVLSSELIGRQIAVDMSRLSSGLYYVQLLGDSLSEFFKIIKE